MRGKDKDKCSGNFRFCYYYVSVTSDLVCFRRLLEVCSSCVFSLAVLSIGAKVGSSGKSVPMALREREIREGA